MLGLTVSIVTAILGLAPGAAQAAPVAPPRYHAATNVVADGGRIWATPSAIYRANPPASFRFFGFNYGVGPAAIKVAPDRRTLCVKRINDVFVLELRTLRLVRRFSTPNVWWHRGRWRSAGFWAEYGRLGLLATDIDTGYGFADRLIVRDAFGRGSCETRRMSLVRFVGRNSVREVVRLADAQYYPGSTGSPYHFRVGSPGVLVFGYPYNGADMQDSVGAYWGGHLRAPVNDRNGNPLLFWEPPIRAGSDVVGLAYAPRDTMEAFETSPRYLYRVSRTGVTVTPVAADIVLVTYDERGKRLGLGRRHSAGVIVEWEKPAAR